MPRAKSEQGEGNGWQEQGRDGKLHLSCVWMCECNNIVGVDHLRGCSLFVEVGAFCVLGLSVEADQSNRN